MSAHTSHPTPLDPALPVREQLLGAAQIQNSAEQIAENKQKRNETFSFSWFFLVFWLTLIATLLFSWYTTQGI